MYFYRDGHGRKNIEREIEKFRRKKIAFKDDSEKIQCEILVPFTITHVINSQSKKKNIRLNRTKAKI